METKAGTIVATRTAAKGAGTKGAKYIDVVMRVATKAEAKIATIVPVRGAKRLAEKAVFVEMLVAEVDESKIRAKKLIRTRATKRATTLRVSTTAETTKAERAARL